MRGQITGLFCILTLTVVSPTIGQPADALLNEDGSYSLELPMIKLEGEPGRYQSGLLRSEESELLWRLVSVEEGRLVNSVQTVSVVRTSEIPIQVFLRTTGSIGACEAIGRHGITRIEDTFNVFLYYDIESDAPPGTSCIDAMMDFTEVIQLPVYGLEPGSYNFVVNDRMQGVFSIPKKNVLP